MLARMRRKGNPFALLVGMQAGAATLENSLEVPQKIKNRTTLWPSNCTTRYLSKVYRCAVSKQHMHHNVYSSTINNSQSMERAQMSIDGWMDKENVVYIYNGVLLGNQKEWNQGTWVAQSVKGPSSAQVMISWFMSSSPTSDSVPGAWVRWPDW